MTRHVRWAWLIVVAWLPSEGAAMEATCGGCPDNCCQWAFAATLVRSNHPNQSVAGYSREFYESYGYDPVPCQDLIDDRRAYDRCALKAYHRCRKQRCCAFKYQQEWSWWDFAGIGEFPGYDELDARLENERMDRAYEAHHRRGMSGTEPMEFFVGQVIVIQDGVVVFDSKHARKGIRDD